MYKKDKLVSVSDWLDKLSVTDLMENPPPKKILWAKWSKSLSDKEKDVISAFRGPIKRRFDEKGYVLFFVVQPVDPDGVVWGDYGHDLLKEEYGYDIYDRPFVIFELRLDKGNGMFRPFLSDGLYLQHNITDRDKRDMCRILKEELGHYFKWNGDYRESLLISSGRAPEKCKLKRYGKTTREKGFDGSDDSSSYTYRKNQRERSRRTRGRK